MSRLADAYLEQAQGDRVKAAARCARSLMRGDPEEFKVGYSAENAVLAVEELFDLDSDEKDAVTAAVSIQGTIDVEYHASVSVRVDLGTREVVSVTVYDEDATLDSTADDLVDDAAQLPNAELAIEIAESAPWPAWEVG